MERMNTEAQVTHIRRTPLPWRTDDGLTECGRAAAPEASQTRDEAVAAFKRLGLTRFALVTCMTCMDRADVRHRAELDAGLLAVLSRELSRVAYRHVEERKRLQVEMDAIVWLIGEHRDEFDAYLTSRAQTSELDEARKRRRA